MREIKYRGMSLNGWVYGHYVMLVDSLGEAVDCIWEIGASKGTPVEYKTIGQFTGLKDKNGTEIYEGDIFALEVPYVYFETGETVYQKEYIPVTFKDGKYVLYEQGIRNHDLCDVLTGWRIREGYKCSGEIIGNIHEDPHLLEE